MRAIAGPPGARGFTPGKGPAGTVFISTEISWPAAERRLGGICAAFEKARVWGPKLCRPVTGLLILEETQLRPFSARQPSLRRQSFRANDVLAAGTLVAARDHGLNVAQTSKFSVSTTSIWQSPRRHRIERPIDFEPDIRDIHDLAGITEK